MSEVIGDAQTKDARFLGPLVLEENESRIKALIDRNKEFAKIQGASFFGPLAENQKPKVLWIGCSDSRVPESTILRLPPGEVFVHRNIANMVPNTDLSSLSVIQYAVEVLGVEDIIVCGHTDCGGASNALGNKRHGLVDHWLQNLRDIRERHEGELSKISNFRERVQRLAELNVIAQVMNLRRHANIQDAVKKGKEEGKGLKIHGLLYDVATGSLKDLEAPEDAAAELYALNIPVTVGDKH